MLVDYLHELAWDEDVECKTAYYLVKSSENEIALLFLLFVSRCERGGCLLPRQIQTWKAHKARKQGTFSTT